MMWRADDGAPVRPQPTKRGAVDWETDDIGLYRFKVCRVCKEQDDSGYSLRARRTKRAWCR